MTFQKSTLLVVNQGDHNLSFVDPGTGKPVAAVDVGGITGHEVAVSPNGKRAFVPIYGNVGVGKPGTDGNLMAVIDVPSRKVVSTVDFGHGVRPHEPTYDARRKVLYVTTELDKSVTILDPETLKIVGSIPTGQEQSHMFALSHDGRFGYTANVGPGTVSVLDMTARKVAAVIPISGNTQRISISNDDKMVFTADQTKPQIAVIDTKTNTVKKWIPMPSIAYGTAPTPDGRWLLAALRSSHQVAVIDLSTLSVARVIDMSGAPTKILVRPDGKVAYVSCGDNVTPINLSTWTAEPKIMAGKGSDGMAWAE